MAIRNWQVFLARELAGRAGNRERDLIVGALIVRGLVARNPQIDVAMLSFPQTADTSQHEWDSAEKPEVLLGALTSLWSGIDVGTRKRPSTEKEISRGLWSRAMVEYLHLPVQEIAAAHEIAGQAKALAWRGYGATSEALPASPETDSSVTIGWTGGGWSSGEGAWNGLRGRGFAGLAGFGSLRDEIVSTTPESAAKVEFLRVYDKLLVDRTYLRTGVRSWQARTAELGYYTGEIDGLWGPKSEAAFLAMRPEAYKRNTTLADLLTIESLRVFAFGSLLASGVARDKWLATNPSSYPDPVAVKADEATRFEVVVPERQEPITATTVTITPVATEDDPDPDPVRVEITLPQAEEEVVVTPVEEGVDNRPASWTPWVVALGSLGLLGAAIVVATKTKGK
jgi:hypothetical protein